MKSSLAQTLIFAAILIFGFAGIFALSAFIEKTRPSPREDWVDEDLALQGRKLKGFVLGTEGLLADWYWMKSLQYVGDKVLASKDEFINIDDLRALNPRLLHPYLDTATDLDPNFIAAYSYGALVLPAIDPEKAVELTQKGIKNNPNEWRLYQYLGYIYWRLGRFDEASDAYSRGSEIAGAPSFMRLMAGAMKNEGGSRETARIIYQQMYDQANDSETKYYGELRLRYLDSLDERDAIAVALQKFKERSGRCVLGWHEVLPLLKGVKLTAGKDFRIDGEGNIVDPSDAPYLLDKENCTVVLDRKKTKIPVN